MAATPSVCTAATLTCNSMSRITLPKIPASTRARCIAAKPALSSTRPQAIRNQAEANSGRDASAKPSVPTNPSHAFAATKLFATIIGCTTSLATTRATNAEAATCQALPPRHAASKNTCKAKFESLHIGVSPESCSSGVFASAATMRAMASLACAPAPAEGNLAITPSNTLHTLVSDSLALATGISKAKWANTCEIARCSLSSSAWRAESRTNNGTIRESFAAWAASA
mmetsp:Transcript_45946/g.127517  ORF Transcript_45946/g.127517 Transcript_45946/m.127517 type:complete len:228 (+) Transcript_45946:614-1297(+)